MLEEHLEKNKDSQNYWVEATEQASTLQSYYSVDFRRKNKTGGGKKKKKKSNTLLSGLLQS